MELASCHSLAPRILRRYLVFLENLCASFSKQISMIIMEEIGSSETSVRTTRRHDPDNNHLQRILSQRQSASC